MCRPEGLRLKGGLPRAVLLAVACLGVGSLVVAPAALAAPDCAGIQPTKTVLSGQGLLESVIADRQGHLYYTDTSKDSLMRLDTPASAPRPIATGIADAGGLILLPDGDILVGQGDGVLGGVMGNVVGLAKILRVDPATGKQTTYASGLSMANGLAMGPRGEIYGSTDVGTSLDKVVGGKVQRNWATILSSNGLAVDRAGKNLYANQTFTPAAIQKIPLDHPENAAPYLTPGPTDLAAGLDGMTIDRGDRLFSTAQTAGQVWRTSTDHTYCAVADGLLLPSSVAFGYPDRDGPVAPIPAGRFNPTSLYGVTFTGTIFEVPNARRLAPASTRVRLRVKPRRARAGQRVKVRLRARAFGPLSHRLVPLPGAKLKIAGHTVRTGKNGRASVRLTFSHARRYQARFVSRFYAGISAKFRVRPA